MRKEKIIEFNSYKRSGRLMRRSIVVNQNIFLLQQITEYIFDNNNRFVNFTIQYKIQQFKPEI